MGWFLVLKTDPSNIKRASLIAGLEYGMEQWNGKWNGTMSVQSCS